MNRLGDLQKDTSSQYEVQIKEEKPASAEGEMDAVKSVWLTNKRTGKVFRVCVTNPMAEAQWGKMVTILRRRYQFWFGQKGDYRCFIRLWLRRTLHRKQSLFCWRQVPSDSRRQRKRINPRPLSGQGFITVASALFVFLHWGSLAVWGLHLLVSLILLAGKNFL